ncbi:hypothetical protein [Archangium lansingense]|uniref:Uncharacterized protein n=1 Tax=Archangium lansingense TaxID=2995310 RepID=A0ABT4AL05_9BACT|nr:hypothetical protein [Archangium lansinium]MCY1082383.1 hypothetical protein [Archangium lansinium]
MPSRGANGWLLVATHTGDEQVHAEPFDAVERRWLALEPAGL